MQEVAVDPFTSVIVSKKKKKKKDKELNEKGYYERRSITYKQGKKKKGSKGSEPIIP